MAISPFGAKLKALRELRDLTKTELARASNVSVQYITDLEAGRRAGVKRCFCRYGFGDPRDEGYDLAVDSLMELAEFVGRAE